MKITVYTGANCPKCPPAKEACKKVCEELSLQFEELNMEEHMIEALQKQIASTPSILIDDEVVFRGTAPTPEELKEEVEKRSKK